MGKKYVYLFSEGNDKMRELLGGKGANLSGMINLGLPVPSGFTVTTEACNKYYNDNRTLDAEIEKQILKAISKTEKVTGKKFGSAENPLLVSVRSGARVSMPGMMDTVLNLGLNDEVVEGLAKLTNNAKFALDCYRRFIMMFSDVVKDVEKHKFEKVLSNLKEKAGVKADSELSEKDLRWLVKEYKAIYKKELKEDFPQDPIQQLLASVKAVFRSWENPRAIIYRRMNDIPSAWGTAVNVQTMVFGNMGDNSGSGVAFTRNPATGEHELYGEYLMNAQGEDVVSGVRTPEPISHLKEQNEEVYNEFVRICHVLEKHYKDMQDMEFTIENGKLYMLQTRNGKRTATAALRIAIELVNEGLITKREALLKVDPKSLDTLLHPTFVESKLKQAKAIATGLPASPGAACGKIALTSEQAKNFKELKQPAILVREETSPEDIEGMLSSVGILTATGGMTSHAAVVARGIGTPCVAGTTALSIREHGNTIKIGDHTFKEGDFISLDGSTGKIYAGIIETEEAQITDNFETVMKWADETAKVGVRANADNKRDAKRAKELGAKGIGLVRTEHMFFEGDRIKAVREMILAADAAERERALNKILPMQRKDFVEIFEVMQELPVTIRFLDMPLHEFLPKEDADIKELAKIMGKTFEELKDVVTQLSEFNPMLGFRGCRLSIVMPEIARMQTRAVIEAAIEVKKKHNINQQPEIMIPLVGEINELSNLKAVVEETANAIIEKSGINLTYHIGTMIEVPRAALLADEIAKNAEFFSFGTNDLTQMTFGYSRDDAGKFLPHYLERKILEFDPFVRIDERGVGKLIDTTVKLGRSVKKDLKCGICGEHAGDPASIDFGHRVGVTYVSCSPYRVPIARLAAAQAAIKNAKK